MLLAFACGTVILLGARLSVFAQPVTPVHRIATLGADTTQVWDVFHRRLKELGYVEGQNLILERRWSHGYEDRVPTLLAELLRTKPDVLVTSMLPPTSRIEAEQCVPILAIAVWEPYGSCRTVPVARMSQASSAREVSAKDGDAMERRGGLRADFRLRTQQDVGGAGGGEEQVMRREDTAERNEHAASYC